MTPNGEVWLGGLRSSLVSIYGFGGGERRLDQLRLLKQIALPNPLRLLMGFLSQVALTIKRWLSWAPKASG